MIDRKALLARNNPRLTGWDVKSPLTVGNGELAFTADITGMQTLYREQRAQYVPLCTMSQWGWHSTPAGENRDVWYRPEDVVKTVYESPRGPVSYASQVQPGNKEAYHWMRENPHRLNLARVGFLWDGREIAPEELSDASQTLSLYEGILRSRFCVKGFSVETETVCAGTRDVLGFRVRSAALALGRLSVLLAFPYGSKEISASDWEHENWHTTRAESCCRESGTDVRFLRCLDRDSYQARLSSKEALTLTRTGRHAWVLSSDCREMSFTLGFSADTVPENPDFPAAAAESAAWWRDFWETCGVMDFSGSTDPRAAELERRIVLSQYLLALQSLGSIPPQETGLTCNSWYGKFHLEMYPWHCAWAPLWHLSGRLKGSLGWFKEHLPQARENAAQNGYRGARWPKMVGPDAVSSPSSIATLLIWQQPHILWMLALVYAAEKDDRLLEEYWEVIQETAEFMCDFVWKNPGTGRYDLPEPLIPAQEEHDPRTTRNPVYELEYWNLTLGIAADWAAHLGKDAKSWRQVAEGMALPAQKDGLYLACETCPDTFTRFNRDHPSMTAAFGLLPGYRIRPELMRATMKKVFECWDFQTMWGWDFAMLAMTAVRLNDPETAVDILLMDTPKNSYAASGNNFQETRTDLPLYLPGNGSLLLAAAMMAAGYPGCGCDLPGFPKDGRWKVAFENLSPFPY